VWCPTANCPLRTWRHYCHCCRTLHTVLVCSLISASQHLPGYAVRPEPAGFSVLTPFSSRSSSHGRMSLVSRFTVLTASCYSNCSRTVFCIRVPGRLQPVPHRMSGLWNNCRFSNNSAFNFRLQDRTLISARFAEIACHCYQ
jgi:hypothetical protein